MKTFDLSAAAVCEMSRVDLATVTEEPASAIGNFDFHGCICGVASFVGTPPWELHIGGDELLHGSCGLFDADRSRGRWNRGDSVGSRRRGCCRAPGLLAPEHRSRRRYDVVHDADRRWRALVR
jgi:hypothetical protein